MKHRTERPIAMSVVRLRLLAELALFVVVAVAVIWSAILVKEAQRGTPLMSVERLAAPQTGVALSPTAQTSPRVAGTPAHAERDQADLPGDTRWFNGRPIRPARTLWMTVTAYSPDHRSCGIFADGKTSTLHSVWTNGMRLVAADTRVLPFGSMITVPGYAGGDVVPVLDRGGKIKGHRLDLLYPDHRTARQWGVRKLPVVVWEYADGLPAPDPRKERQ